MTVATSAGLCFDLSDEQRMLQEMVRDFVARECPPAVARELEGADEFPRDLAERIAAAGLNGVGIPEVHGGQGGGIVEQCIVCEELSRSLGGLAWMWGITTWSGAKAVLHHGTDEQRAQLLPRMAAGELLFAFGLTEPGGGTDVLGAMKTRARRDDARGGWVVNGTKIWSTMAHVADKLLVLARTSDEDKASRGLTMLLVDGAADGMTATPIPKLGMRSLGSCEVGFDDVFVPDADVIGEVGRGWGQVVGSLNSERIMVAAMCTGVLQGVLDTALAYAQERTAFGKPIGALQAVQHLIADMAMDLETCRLHTYRSAWLEQEGRPCGLEATTAKCVTAELACKGADNGIQVLGGYGYAMEYDMQRYWRDVRLYRIGPISSEMARNYVGEQLGLPRSF